MRKGDWNGSEIMPDIEKVVKGLEHCMRESDNLYDNPCDGCPYYVEKQPSGICSGELQKDCYDLLKEQDNQIHHMGLIIEEHEKELQRNPVIVCPHCGKRMK